MLGTNGESMIAILIEYCKLNTVNPHDWLIEMPARLANGHPANLIGGLMPWTAVA